MRFGEGWQQPPCPVSPTPAPPCLPLKRGEPHRQLGLLLATPGKAVVMGPGHCPAGTTYTVSQSPPLKGQDAGQGRRGDARTHKCTGTDTVHRHRRVHTYGHLASLYRRGNCGSRGGATCPRSLFRLPCHAGPPLQVTQLGRDSEEGTQACSSPRPAAFPRGGPLASARTLWAPAPVPWPSRLPRGSTLALPRTPILQASRGLRPGLLACASVLRAGQARGQAGAGGRPA